MIVVANPSEIRNPPNALLGPHGPKPDANTSENAAMPIPKDTTPHVAKLFTTLMLNGVSKSQLSKTGDDAL
jgi:hypothetical protein